MAKWFSAILFAANAAFAVRSMLIAIGSRGQAIRPVLRQAQDDALSAIIPARNEERQIEQCVRSLLAQRYENFEVIVVDDRSEDATAEIVRNIAREDARLKVVSGKPLPVGWVGKPWALQQMPLPT